MAMDFEKPFEKLSVRRCHGFPSVSVSTRESISVDRVAGLGHEWALKLSSNVRSPTGQFLERFFQSIALWISMKRRASTFGSRFWPASANSQRAPAGKFPCKRHCGSAGFLQFRRLPILMEYESLRKLRSTHTDP